MVYLRYVILLAACFIVSRAADILLLSSISSISHSLWYGKLALLLAVHGHQVVVLDTDPVIFKHANITHRVMEGGYNWINTMEDQVKANPDALDDLVEPSSVLSNIMLLADPSFLGCDVLLKSDGTKKFRKEFKGKKFDLIIADGFCESFYGFIAEFGNPPLISACPYMEVIATDFVGMYDNPSYVPFHLAPFETKMNFLERMFNTVHHILNSYAIRNLNLPRSDKAMREVFGPSVPTLEHFLRNNLQLVMTGYHPVSHGAKPIPPSFIPLAGFHVDPPKPLPQDIKKFLDGAKDGAILFSMGSNFKSILMSPEKREMFLSVFKGIPQRVIWKLEIDNSTEIPPNVMITKWLPQSDILAHPNVKAFISHGGMLGTQEAIHRGVPVLGLPLMYDQIYNMARLEREGVAIRLYYKKLNSKYIARQIDTIVNDPSYMFKMKKYSAAFRDAPQTPQERALFWIEYVLRNAKNGKNYLRSSSLDLAWYQRLLLDLAAFVLACLVIIYFIIRSILKLMCSLVCGTKASVQTVNMQKKKL